MKTFKKKLYSFLRFLMIILISLFLSFIFTVLLHASNALKTIENFIISHTNEIIGKIISLFSTGLILSIIFFSIIYIFIRLFHNQNKLLSNDNITHEYLLQFREVKDLAIIKLEERLQQLFLQEGRNKQKKISNKLINLEIREIQTKLDDLRHRPID